MRAPSEFVASVVRPEIRALKAYEVTDAAGLIKLDAMENPYPLPQEVRAKIAAAVADVPINRYPDGGAKAVKSALREAFGIGDDLGIVLGNGSDELIQMLTVAVAAPGATIMAPDPSFVMYRMNAVYAGVRFVGVPLAADFSLDPKAMQQAIERERPALVFLAYPNNPTGNLFAPEHMDAVLRAAPGLVVVDEAYHAFAGTSFLPRLRDYPNLVVMRTVSKIGMAGLRLGYAIGAREWTAELEKIRQPYNLNALTQAVAPVLLREGAMLEAQATSIKAERTRIAAALSALPGVQVFTTHTNFVLARVPDAPRWFERLREARILVKNLHGWHPLLANCLRITVGTPEENSAVLAALPANR